MRYPSHRRSGTLVASIVLIVATLGITICAQAQNQLGPVNNVLLKNPYASPTYRSYGRGVVSGDFDGDGIADLAISETDGTHLRILLGMDFTVGGPPSFNFMSSTVTLPFHSPEMASGDFDGDGRDEIAVGATTATNGVSGAGEVYVINRLANNGWTVQSVIHAGGNYPGSGQSGAAFGNSLAAGDFNNDGYADLAIGIRGQTVSHVLNAGAVMITYGSALGITPDQAWIVDRNNDGRDFAPSNGDLFGWALAAGDFNGDGEDDLAIGILQGTCPNGVDRGGAVVVLNGSWTHGISNAGSHIWRPGASGIAGNCSPGGHFGSALAAGNFGQRGAGAHAWDDLVIGAPSTDSNAGAVHVIYGSITGLASPGNQRLLPPALPGIISGNGHFGSVVATGLLATSCFDITLFCPGDSLAVGAPYATINGTSDAGAVWVFDSTFFGGIVLASARPILPIAPVKIAGPHSDDQFGKQIVVGDFNDDGHTDIAISAPNYDDGAAAGAGAVQVLYQSELIFLDGFD